MLSSAIANGPLKSKKQLRDEKRQTKTRLQNWQSILDKSETSRDKLVGIATAVIQAYQESLMEEDILSSDIEEQRKSEAKIKMLEMQLATEKVTTANLRQGNLDFIKRCTQAENEMTKLKEERENADNNHRQQENKAVDKAKKKVRQEFRDQITTLEKEKQNLQEKHAEEILQLKQQLQNEIATRDSQIADLQKSLEGSEMQLKRVQDERDRRLPEETKNKLNSKISKLENENSALDKRISGLDRRNTKLRDDLEKELNKLQILNEENEALHENVKGAESHVRKAEEKNAETFKSGLRSGQEKQWQQDRHGIILFVQKQLNDLKQIYNESSQLLQQPPQIVPVVVNNPKIAPIAQQPSPSHPWVGTDGATYYT